MSSLRLVAAAAAAVVLFGSCAIIGAASKVQTVLTSEEDPELAAGALPTFIMASEALLEADPHNQGKVVTAASLYVMYANAFVQGPASALPDDRFEEKQAAYDRAGALYRRAFRILSAALDRRSPGIVEAAVDGKADFSRMRKSDVPLLYWSAVSVLAGFGLNPLDFKSAHYLGAAPLFLARAAELDPGWNCGAIYGVYVSYYAGMPSYLGGDPAKAEDAYKKALGYSKGGTRLPIRLLCDLGLHPQGRLRRLQGRAREGPGHRPERGPRKPPRDRHSPEKRPPSPGRRGQIFQTPRRRNHTMKSRNAAFALLLSVLAPAPGFRPQADAQTITLRMAANVPANSPWDLGLKRLAAEFDRVSGGRVKIVFPQSAHVATESDIIQKMRLGVDGALLTTFGLAELYPDSLALSMPSFIRNDAEFDAVLEAVEPLIESKLGDRYVVLAISKGGWITVFLQDAHHLSRPTSRNCESRSTRATTR